MDNRTTVSVQEGQRDKARDIKDDHGESWNDVLQFYAEHRETVTIADGDGVDENTLATVESRLGSIERALEELQR